MAEGDKKEGLWGAFAHAAAQLAHTPLPYLVGIAVMLAASHWDGHLRDTKGCFDLKEIGGRVFNVDSCAGKTVEIASATPTPTAASAPASAASR